MSSLQKNFIAVMFFSIHFFIISGATRSFDRSQGENLFSAEAPYPFLDLIGHDGQPTDFFLQMKAQTDTFVEKKLSMMRMGHVASIEVWENGDCSMPRESFEIRQALAIALQSKDQIEYEEVYAHFNEAYLKLKAGLPATGASTKIEDVFLQRKLRDQYWRVKLKEKILDENSDSISNELKQIFHNYVVYEICLVDFENRSFLKRFIEENGWPSIEKYGPTVSSAAWLFAQHADQDLAFQRRVLSLLEQRLNSEFFDKTAYAYLYDRVAVNSMKPQRYGTQVYCNNGSVTPRPLENKSKLNELRESVYLDHIEEYLALFSHCGDAEAR